MTEIVDTLDKVTNEIIKYFITLPMLLLAVWLLVSLAFCIWLKIEDHYNINFFKLIIHKKNLIKQSDKVMKRLQQCDDESKRLEKERLHQRKVKEGLDIIKNGLRKESLEINKKIKLYDQMTKQAKIQEENELVEHICKIITKLPSANSYAKNIKPYVAMQQNMGSNYMVNGKVREVLEDELNGSEYQKVLMSIYDNLMSFHHNPILVSWIIYSQFKC